MPLRAGLALPCAKATPVTRACRVLRRDPYSSRSPPRGPVSKMIRPRLVALCGAVVAATPLQAVNAYPLFAQWGGYGLSPSRQNFQRGNGWSTGDYFGSRLTPSRSQASSPGSYPPGLQQNLRYRSDSCSQFIHCRRMLSLDSSKMPGKIMMKLLFAFAAPLAALAAPASA